MPSELISPALVVALTAYAIGVASPGPSNMAIMAAAMSQGRRQALALAAGVVCGSLVWGIAAALGFSALMHMYSWALVSLKILGGFYLLYLSVRAARTAWAPQPTRLAARTAADSEWRAFAGGLGMHITNPKAIFVWLSIVAIALPSSASLNQAFAVVASCAVIGALVFFGYALAFSTEMARSIYSKSYRWFNATLSVVFAFAGVRLLLSAKDA